MAYCTKSDILEQLDEASLIELTDDAGIGYVDDNKVTRAISSADATIDSHVQGKYTVPLSPVPEKVRDLSVDIAIYNIYSRRDDTMPETRRDRYKDAIRFLEKVANGKVQFDDATPAPTTTGDTVDVDSETRIFTRDKMKGF